MQKEKRQEELDKLLQKITEVCNKNDIRLGQLLSLATFAGSLKEKDLFYIENSELQKLIEQIK